MYKMVDLLMTKDRHYSVNIDFVSVNIMEISLCKHLNLQCAFYYRDVPLHWDRLINKKRGLRKKLVYKYLEQRGVMNMINSYLSQGMPEDISLNGLFEWGTLGSNDYLEINNVSNLSFQIIKYPDMQFIIQAENYYFKTNADMRFCDLANARTVSDLDYYAAEVRDYRGRFLSFDRKDDFVLLDCKNKVGITPACLTCGVLMEFVAFQHKYNEAYEFFEIPNRKDQVFLAKAITLHQIAVATKSDGRKLYDFIHKSLDKVTEVK